jgi:hypothetical protein
VAPVVTINSSMTSSTAAAARVRTLLPLGAPCGLLGGVVAGSANGQFMPISAQFMPISGWPVTSAASRTSYLRNDLVLRPQSVDHNSIVATADVPAPAGAGVRAAKQAAPPRGVPR